MNLTAYTLSDEDAEKCEIVSHWTNRSVVYYIYLCLKWGSPQETEKSYAKAGWWTLPQHRRSSAAV